MSNKTRVAQIIGSVVAIIIYITLAVLFKRDHPQVESSGSIIDKNTFLSREARDISSTASHSQSTSISPVHNNNIMSMFSRDRATPSQDPKEAIVGPDTAPLKSSLSTQSEVDSVAGGCRKKGVTGWCADVVEKLKFNPVDHEKAPVPEKLKAAWYSRNCDNLYKHQHICSKPVSRCPLDHLESSEKFPLIAVMAATTTRRVSDPHVQKIALFTLLLPSLIRSLDCGYRYVYVMGYDVGDPFYDSEEGMAEVETWFRRQVHEPMRRNGIVVTLKPVKVKNPLKKPGPVFNEMARAASALGADFFYRVNDDTEFRGRWPKLYVDALLSLPAPYGVVGPSSLGSSDAILTHDFVHRLHMDIFHNDYYPPELTDWWMDDWISRVYGQKRTLISKEVAVVHHTYAHGQRYVVDKGNQRLVPKVLKRGREFIRKWMVEHQATPEELHDFDHDVFAAKFKMKQVPK